MSQNSKSQYVSIPYPKSTQICMYYIEQHFFIVPISDLVPLYHPLRKCVNQDQLCPYLRVLLGSGIDLSLLRCIHVQTIDFYVKRKVLSLYYSKTFIDYPFLYISFSFSPTKKSKDLFCSDNLMFSNFILSNQFLVTLEIVLSSSFNFLTYSTNCFLFIYI